VQPLVKEYNTIHNPESLPTGRQGLNNRYLLIKSVNQNQNDTEGERGKMRIYLSLKTILDFD